MILCSLNYDAVSLKKGSCDWVLLLDRLDSLECSLMERLILCNARSKNHIALKAC